MNLLLLAASLLLPPHEAVEEARLFQTIRSLPIKRSPLPDEEHRIGLNRALTLLTDELRSLGHAPRLQDFVWTFPLRRLNAPGTTDSNTPPPDPADATFTNIIVDLPGRESPHEVILVSAHYDAVPHCPGADDDGTGVAAVMELARVLKNRPTRRTIRLVLFTLEEAGLIGSNHYVTDWVKQSKLPGPDNQPRERIIGMISLEMLGYFSDEPDSQKSPIPKLEGVFDPPTIGDSICIVGIARHQSFSGPLAKAMKSASPDLKITLVDFLPVPVPDMTRSDHRPFLLAGLPGVMITDTANFRNPHYHRPTDTIDTLDPRRFTLVVRAVAGAVYELAGPFADPAVIHPKPSEQP